MGESSRWLDSSMIPSTRNDSRCFYDAAQRCIGLVDRIKVLRCLGFFFVSFWLLSTLLLHHRFFWTYLMGSLDIHVGSQSPSYPGTPWARSSVYVPIIVSMRTRAHPLGIHIFLGSLLLCLLSFVIFGGVPCAVWLESLSMSSADGYTSDWW